MNPSLHPLADFVGIALAAAVCELARRQGIRLHRNRRRYLEARRRLDAERDNDRPYRCYHDSSTTKEGP